jgi:kinesin family protein 11
MAIGRRSRTPADQTAAPNTNIKVVVRCRGRNQREIQSKSSVILDTSCDNEISVAIDNDRKRKTYKVDHVFGPEADQSMVYDEVVQPMLEEVLAGMNCTVFAYGQTGTGKTYVKSLYLSPMVLTSLDLP